jgi:hypothetical protein
MRNNNIAMGDGYSTKVKIERRRSIEKAILLRAFLSLRVFKGLEIQGGERVKRPTNP